MDVWKCWRVGVTAKDNLAKQLWSFASPDPKPLDPRSLTVMKTLPTAPVLSPQTGRQVGFAGLLDVHKALPVSILCSVCTNQH